MISRSVVRITLAALASAQAVALPVAASDENLLKGIDDYKHKHYEDAASELGAALPTEFNNPYLHYYMANCMVHLRYMDAAIREYRIAYALQPDGKVGDYCKLCLDRFGIDAEGKKGSEPKTLVKTDPRKAPLFVVPEPPSAAELAALRAHPRDGSPSAIERQRSVNNLQALMQGKHTAFGAPTPTPVGTNLYVRNYKEIPGLPAQQQTPVEMTPPPLPGLSGLNSNGLPPGFQGLPPSTINPQGLPGWGTLGTGTGSGAGTGTGAGTGLGTGTGTSTGTGTGSGTGRTGTTTTPQRGKNGLWWW